MVRHRIKSPGKISDFVASSSRLDACIQFSLPKSLGLEIARNDDTIRTATNEYRTDMIINTNT